MKTSSLKSTKSRPSPGGFTLIELLLVVAIIAVLSTLAIGVVVSSQNDARVSATRSRIAVIERMLAAELEDFEVRRSPLPFNVIANIAIRLTGRANQSASFVGTPKWSPADQSLLLHGKNLKRMLTVDLMRCEFPDISGNPTDIGIFPSPELRSYVLNNLDSSFTADVVAIFNVASRRFATGNVTRWTNWGGIENTNSNLTAGSDEQNRADSAEILYRILSDLDNGGASGIDAIGGSRAIGNTDGDTFPEVVDAWGDPIAFQLHQNLVIPEGQEGPLSGGLPTLSLPVSGESGVWKDWEGPERFTNLANPLDATLPAAVRSFVALPVLPNEVRFFLTSINMLEIDGEPTDFITARNFVDRYRNF